MRSIRDCPMRATFLLPEGAALGDAVDRCLPLDFECELDLHGAGLILAGGPSRQALFAALAPFLQVLCTGIYPQSIAVTLSSADAHGVTVRDRWSVIVGANVAFCPGGLGPEIPAASRAPPSAIQGGDC
jgi:hypothetical protein